VHHISGLLFDYQPRLAQFLIDHAISDIMPSDQRALTGARLRGVVEIAIDLGYKVDDKNRSTLGKFVKKLCAEFSQAEERLVNGRPQKVAVYPDDQQEVIEAIHKFFS
jgi:hypothetical protein